MQVLSAHGRHSGLLHAGCHPLWDTGPMRDARIAIADLMLDVSNPRHDEASGQREAVAALLDDGADKMVKLAEDIVENGLSPIDKLLVMPDAQDLFTVLEGNRRVATLKLLVNPSLADGHASESQFRLLAQRIQVPSELPCAVAGSREEARPWLERKHTGERGGAGVIPWSTEASQRFSRSRGTQADRALTVIDALVSTFDENKKLQTDLQVVRTNKLTTLGRLVSDPFVRESFGFELENGELLVHYSAQDFEPLVEKIISDLSEGMTVTDLKSKTQRREYVEKIRESVPATDRYVEDASILTSSSPAKKKARKKAAKPSKVPPKSVFDGLEITNLGSRVAAILAELKSLDVDTYPNASAVLLRCVLELSIDQVYNEKNWPQKGELKNRVRKCLHEVDNTDVDTKYQAVRAGLTDGTSVLAVKTLHGYVHNPHFHASGTEVRTIAANYEAFLSALDALV